MRDIGTGLMVGLLALLAACSKAEAPAATTDGIRAAAAPAAATAAAGAIPAESAGAPAASGQQAASSTDNVLSAQGYGPVRFGMTLAQAGQAAGSKAALPQPFDPECSMVRFASLPKLRFMVEKDVVTRADAEAGVPNALAIEVGDTLDKVKARHPALQASPGKYDAGDQVLTSPSADGQAAIIIEVHAGKVAKIRAGRQPAVAYVETCG